MPSNLPSKANRERAAFVIIPLLIFQLALLSIQMQNPSEVKPIQALALTLQAPIVNASSGITDGLSGVWNKYIWVVGARAENERLQENVRQLSLLNNSYEEIRQENIRLRRLLSMNEGMAYKTIGARVIARTPGFLSNVLYINRGSMDGVKVDSPVISGGGIIGRTVLVTGGQSQVQLVTNPDASVGAMMERTRTPGILRGSGDLLLDLQYIGNTEQIEAGDIVLSSGLDGIFPKGLAIGKVVDSRKNKGIFHYIKVEPLVNLYHIEEVSVLLTGS